MSDEQFLDPEKTDFHGRKRELLRLGVEQGKLTWKQITAGLPAEFTGETEFEVFLFTCRNMGIELVDLPEHFR